MTSITDTTAFISWDGVDFENYENTDFSTVITGYEMILAKNLTGNKNRADEDSSAASDDNDDSRDDGDEFHDDSVTTEESKINATRLSPY